MNLIWGIILIILSLVGWLGQVITLFSPLLAARLGVAEPESDVDPAFFADVRGEAAWDAMTLWTLPLAGILLVLDNAAWAYFGLVGGGMYLYFAGRGVAARMAMQRRGIRIGKPETLKTAYAALVLWGLAAAITIVMAVAELPLP